MRSDLLDYLACPACGGDLRLEGGPLPAASASTPEGGGATATSEPVEVSSGTLKCVGCGHSYAVSNGIPRLNEALAEHQLTSVAQTFGFQWNAHHAGEFEEETLFGRTREEDWAMVLEGMGITEDEIRGATVLDAGCGSGRFCQLFAEHGAAKVVGADMNDAVDAAARYCSRYENIDIVQANIFQLPFKRGAFDLVWCNGVIHHTPDAAGAHKSLARHVRPGGILYVWVYAKRFNPFRLTKDVLDRVGVSRLPARWLKVLTNTLAVISLGFLWAYRAARALPWLRPRTAWGKQTVRPRTLEELQLTWFDAISPEFVTRHTEPEVIDWFVREGFHGIAALEEPKVGVRGIAP